MPTFQRVCFSCHSRNRAGDANVGPDLNVPHSGIENLGDGKLSASIRDPQSLRWWPGSRMSAIDERRLSDADLKDLLVYLHIWRAARHRRVQGPDAQWVHWGYHPSVTYLQDKNNRGSRDHNRFDAPDRQRARR